jgi:type IV secretory pathway VirB2 component (pilin)
MRTLLHAKATPASNPLISVRLADVLLLVSLAVVFALMPDLAAANVLDNFGDAILGILNNGFLRAIAIMAVIGAGLMALSGRIQWGQFLIIMLAVVIVFGSAGIVDYIIANSGTAGI